MYVEANSLIIISQLVKSFCLCPNVIPLSGFYSFTLILFSSFYMTATFFNFLIFMDIDYSESRLMWSLR